MRKSAPIRFGTIKARSPLTLPGQRVGLIGGSFNPPHAAHLLISQIALRRLGLNRVWWIVTPSNPLKGRNELTPLEERLTQSKVVAHDPRIEVTAFEQNLPTRFTAGTLAFLRHRHPGVHFVWIMGADCLAEFHRWGQWQEIMVGLPVAVVDRPGLHLKALASRCARAFSRYRQPESRASLLAWKHPPAWVFLTGARSALSSTAIRAERQKSGIQAGN